MNDRLQQQCRWKFTEFIFFSYAAKRWKQPGTASRWDGNSRRPEVSKRNLGPQRPTQSPPRPPPEGTSRRSLHEVLGCPRRSSLFQGQETWRKLLSCPPPRTDKDSFLFWFANLLPTLRLCWGSLSKSISKSNSSLYLQFHMIIGSDLKESYLSYLGSTQSLTTSVFFFFFLPGIK